MTSKEPTQAKTDAYVDMYPDAVVDPALAQEMAYASAELEGKVSRIGRKTMHISRNAAVGLTGEPDEVSILQESSQARHDADLAANKARFYYEWTRLTEADKKAQK